jgi:superfamily II DNA/RNA helicase
MTFESLGLDARLLLALSDLGFTTPTPVQAKSIPNLLQGTDWMVTSQTGTGKTAAYLLPTLQRIAMALDAQAATSALEATAAKAGFGGPNVAASAAANANADSHGAVPAADKNQNFKNRPGRRNDRQDKRFGGKPGPCEPLALVLCPTRELAQQVADDAIKLVKHLRGVHVASIIGGMPFGKQLQQLRGANIVVATPGRLLDLFQQKSILLNKVEVLIADEADRMLDMGFVDDLHLISNACSNRTQTQMFSATFAPNVVRLAQAVMNNPQRLDLAPITQRNENITQMLHWVDNLQHKNDILDHWLRDEGIDQAIVFASTQIDTERLAQRLDDEGFPAAALHGAMPQAVRNRRLAALREGRFKILVATDVAARGIDVSTITHVFNYGLPMKSEDYVHRIGRTGRAGRSGIAITLAERHDRHKVRAIEQITRQNLTASTIPGLEPRSPEPSRGGGGGGNFRGNNGGGGGYRGNNGGGGGGGFGRNDRPAWGSPGPAKPGYGGGRDFAPRDFQVRDGGQQRGFAPRDNGGRDNGGRDFAQQNFNQGQQNFNQGPRDRPAFEKPAFGKPAFGKPAFGKPAFDKPAFDKPAFNKPAFGGRSDAPRPNGQWESTPWEAKAEGKRPPADKGAFAKPAFGKPAFGKPAFGKPAFGKPAFGKPAFGKKAA